MRNEIISAGLILLETVLLVCVSGGESPFPLSSRETDDGYNLHERLGMKARRRKRETGTGGSGSGGDGGAAATAEKGTLITSR